MLDSLFGLLGVDYRQWRALVVTALRLDFRSGSARMNHQETQGWFSGPVRLIAVYMVVGLLISTLIYQTEDVYISGLVYLSILGFLIGVIVTAIPVPFVAVRPTLAEIPMLLGVGLSGAAAQWFFSTAFRYAPATIVSIFNYSGIVWATLFGWLIWNDWPATIVLVGASIVIAANVMIIWRESRLARASLGTPE